MPFDELLILILGLNARANTNGTPRAHGEICSHHCLLDLSPDDPPEPDSFDEDLLFELNSFPFFLDGVSSVFLAGFLSVENDGNFK